MSILWHQVGKLCDVSQAPYNAQNGTNATTILQQAIDDCGDLPGGGTVRVPSGLVLSTASLWLKSNMTLRVESGCGSPFFFFYFFDFFLPFCLNVCGLFVRLIRCTWYRRVTADLLLRACV